MMLALRSPDLSLLWDEPAKLFWYVLGLATCQGWQFVKAKWQDRRHPEDAPHHARVFNSFWIVMLMGLALTVWLTMRSQDRYEYIRDHCPPPPPPPAAGIHLNPQIDP